MNGSFTLDASVGFAWVHPLQSSDYAESVLERVEAGAEAVVPALWPLEVANATLVAVRRKRMTVADRRIALEYLRALNVTIDLNAPALAFGKISELAQQHGLTICDACYLELAIRRNLPLATQDRSLQRAATDAGINLL